MFFREFMELFQPEFAQEIDWSHPLEFLDKELNSILPKAAGRTVDVLAKARTLRPAFVGDQSWLLLVHVEVQAHGSAKQLGRRIFTYFGRTADWFKLPVLPIAVYVNLQRDGIGWQEHFVSIWGHELVRCRFPYIALAGLDAEQFLTKENPLAWALTRLMRIDAARRAEVKAESLRRLEQSRLDDEHRRTLVECVDVYTPLNGKQQREFEQLMHTKPYQEVKAMMKSTFEKVAEQSRAEGVERGYHELLLAQLERKFGPLSSRTRKRVEALSAVEAKRLGIKFVNAKSLAELGL